MEKEKREKIEKTVCDACGKLVNLDDIKLFDELPEEGKEKAINNYFNINAIFPS